MSRFRGRSQPPQAPIVFFFRTLHTMAKDPAFLFYPGDWQLGTMHLTLLEKGCYIELLILQFAKGKFTEAQAKHMLNGSFDLAWANIREKFETDGTFFWNKRLEYEKERRKKYTDSRKSNGSAKKQTNHMHNHMGEHMHKHTETETINKNENRNKEILGEVFYNAEELVSSNPIEFERICLTVGRSKEQAKESLRKYHLFLQDKEQYPKQRRAIFAGFEKWLMNEKSYPQTQRRVVGKDAPDDKL